MTGDKLQTNLTTNTPKTILFTESKQTRSETDTKAFTGATALAATYSSQHSAAAAATVFGTVPYEKMCCSVVYGQVNTVKCTTEVG